MLDFLLEGLRFEPKLDKGDQVVTPIRLHFMWSLQFLLKNSIGYDTWTQDNWLLLYVPTEMELNPK